MTMQAFLKSPWSNSHDKFEDSFFNIRPAPEFSTGEVILSSTYRTSGFKDVTEKQVKGLGDALSRAADRDRRTDGPSNAIHPDTWRTVLDRLMQSPKVAKQSSKRFMSLSPVVPDAALYSGAARLSGNPWNPGQLVRRIILMGADSEDGAQGAWSNLHAALGVAPDDDVWARWLQGEFELRRKVRADWSPNDLQKLDAFPAEERLGIQYPAKQFVADLKGIITAKQKMTRRQWISLLEAVLRIGTVSHVLWLCEVNGRIWDAVRAIIEDEEAEAPHGTSQVTNKFLEVKPRMLPFGHPAVPVLRDYASRYLSARLGLNCALWALDEIGENPPSLNSVAGIISFLAMVKKNRTRLAAAGAIEAYHSLQDREVRTIACKKGVGANLMEFAQYTLGQRQTMDKTLRGYDQGYFLRKRGAASNSPWVLALGPAAVLAMTHCCLHEVSGPRSVQRLAKHLSSYGIEFDLHGLNESGLGQQLRMLGLVLDSPDAESGMLLVPPFAS